MYRSASESVSGSVLVLACRSVLMSVSVLALMLAYPWVLRLVCWSGWVSGCMSAAVLAFGLVCQLALASVYMLVLKSMYRSVSGTVSGLVSMWAYEWMSAAHREEV